MVRKPVWGGSLICLKIGWSLVCTRMLSEFLILVPKKFLFRVNLTHNGEEPKWPQICAWGTLKHNSHVCRIYTERSVQSGYKVENISMSFLWNGIWTRLMDSEGAKHGPNPYPFNHLDLTSKDHWSISNSMINIHLGVTYHLLTLALFNKLYVSLFRT